MYFMSKMRPNKWNPDYPYDHLKENISRYDIICGIGDDAHFAPDYEMGVRLGWGGLVERIEHWKKVNTTPEQQHFYALHLRVIRAVQGWIQRHVDEARRLAATCGDPEKKALLTELADMNERIISDAPGDPARSLPMDHLVPSGVPHLQPRRRRGTDRLAAAPFLRTGQGKRDPRR